MQTPRIVIVGGGFGGLAAAKALRKAPAEVVLIDRSNHHLFQPLLYQVATSILTPGQIASPLRSILGDQRNTSDFLGEVTSVDKEKKCVFVNSADRTGIPVSYDFLILATGASPNHQGNSAFEQFAPGLKSLADAVAIRNQVLQAFEQAEAEEDPSRHRDLLTFVLVGAGPTGVEMAGALALLVHRTFRSEYRRINPESARIILLDRSERVLGSFAPELSLSAERRIKSLGVEVRHMSGVDKIDAEGVVVGGERIATRTVIWTAGVTPSPAGRWINAETDRAGRVRVLPDLSVPGHPEIMVVGDTATVEQNGKPLPGVAQVALQQGGYAGKLLHRRLTGKPALAPFSYFDKGNMAVVEKGFAVLESGKIKMAGLFAWLAWVFIHLQFLGQSSQQMSVGIQWAWTFLTAQRGSRLIINHHSVKTHEN
jgi:NADH dehydrogenase FAD-containing subunit